MKNKDELQRLKNFVNELKRILRNLGKSNYISTSIIKELFKQYNL